MGSIPDLKVSFIPITIMTLDALGKIGVVGSPYGVEVPERHAGPARI